MIIVQEFGCQPVPMGREFQVPGSRLQPFVDGSLMEMLLHVGDLEVVF